MITKWVTVLLFNTILFGEGISIAQCADGENSTDIGTLQQELLTIINITMPIDGGYDSRLDWPKVRAKRSIGDVVQHNRLRVRLKRNAVEPLTAKLMIVFDHAAFAKFDQNAQRVYDFCSQLVNQMNSHLSKLFIKVYLVDVVIWNQQDSINISSDAVKTESDFTYYNKEYLLSKSKHTHAQLITGVEQLNEKNPKNTTLNTICTDWSSSVVTLRSVNDVKLQAVSNTQEFAHSLNIAHTGSKCSECIMLPNSEHIPVYRDKWTVGNLKDFTSIIEQKQCLFEDSSNIEIFKPNTCGNWELDPGEECDIGQRDKNNTELCVAWTCQLMSSQDISDNLQTDKLEVIHEYLLKTINFALMKLTTNKSHDKINEQTEYLSKISHHLIDNSSSSQANLDNNSTHPPKDVTAYRPLTINVVLVVDHTAYRRFNKDAHRVNDFCIRLVKDMNYHFDTLYIQIVLVDVIIWYDKNSINITSSAIETVNEFADYSKNTLHERTNHTHAQLITGKHLLDSMNRTNLGRAQLNTICTEGSSSVVMLHDMNNVKMQAVTNVHEIAHSLNIKHTTSNCSDCIMAPDASVSPTPPSQWTASNLLDFTKVVGKKDCLYGGGQVTPFQANTCGNGIVEAGEECDIGQRDTLDNSCCLAWSCKFAVNASCEVNYEFSISEYFAVEVTLPILIPIIIWIIILVIIIIGSLHKKRILGSKKLRTEWA